MAVAGQTRTKRWATSYVGSAGAVWVLQNIDVNLSQGEVVEHWLCTQAATGPLPKQMPPHPAGPWPPPGPPSGPPPGPKPPPGPLPEPKQSKPKPPQPSGNGGGGSGYGGSSSGDSYDNQAAFSLSPPPNATLDLCTQAIEDADTVPGDLQAIEDADTVPGDVVTIVDDSNDARSTGEKRKFEVHTKVKDR